MSKIDETLVRKILASGLFDDAWYCSTYPDVPAVQIPPLEHYLRFGALLGRVPSLSFDSEYYLRVHPDVKAAGMNPLLHYVRYGKAEGRSIAPVTRFGSSRSAPELARESAAKLPLTALVITWDVGHNPLGRSYMLAEVLDRVVRNVVVAGFQFKRYGNAIWEPLRDARLPVIRLPGHNFPEFTTQLERLSQRIRPDIVFACKPRLPSLQLAAMIKHRFGCPLVLDIDDHELSFFGGGEEIDIKRIEAMPDGSGEADAEPYGELWTRLAQNLRRYADETIVSNIALQQEFGGTIVPHVRDERVFDPELHDRTQSRTKYGVPVDAKVVLFFGTPRQHKGIDVLAAAVGRISDAKFMLVVVGTPSDRGITRKLEALAQGRLTWLSNQPFAMIPEIMAMADVVCLPQDENSPISRYQLPAKAIDAIAMGIPLLVASTPPLMELVRDGVATRIDPEHLPRMLQSTVAAGRDGARATAIRERYLRSYSYASAAKSLRALVLRARSEVNIERTRDLPIVIAHQRRLFATPSLANPPVAKGVDIVVFWKQNDTGLYGRRSDMVIRYLASRPDVRRVVVFDAPISEHELLLRRDRAAALTHDRLIYTRTYEKLFGNFDTDKVSFDVLVHQVGKARMGQEGTGSASLSEAYLHHVSEVLAREGVDPAAAVFWIYPKNYFAPDLLKRFVPAKVVVDVVDDHRAWPGITDAEHQRLTRNYEDVLKNADMAFANCVSVIEAMRAFAPEIRLVPNGCDQTTQSVHVPDSVAFRDFAAFPGKTIGFIGNLEKKIDIALIAKIAARFPECQVALLGSVHANPEVLELQHLPNVRMPGVVPYDEIGAWVSRFDVGIIPHLDMELTRSMNPLKLYVYLSWGVPVVATDVHNVDRDSAFLKVAFSHEQFLEGVSELLAAGRPPSGALDDYIRENSWETRFGPHVDALLKSMAA